MNLFTLSRVTLGFGLIVVGCATQLDDNNYQSPNVTEVASTVSPAMLGFCENGTDVVTVDCPRTLKYNGGFAKCGDNYWEPTPPSDSPVPLFCFCGSKTNNSGRLDCTSINSKYEPNSSDETCVYDRGWPITKTGERAKDERDAPVFYNGECAEYLKRNQEALDSACTRACAKAPLREAEVPEWNKQINCCAPATTSNITVE